MIEIKNLCKSYGHLKVLKNINLNIYENEVLGIVGPNGVGKTTLIESICGIVKVNSGDICIDGNHRFPADIRLVVASKALFSIDSFIFTIL